MSTLPIALEQLSPLQRAVFALKETRAQLDELKQARAEPIAIIGMACRLPGGANDPEAFWGLLRDGVDAVSEIPPDRWDADEYYDPDLGPNTMNTRWGGFLDQLDQFDPAFFEISPREAACMDPQQRLLLEVAWEALESAALPPNRLAGSSTGVFVGISTWDYSTLLVNAPARAGTGVVLSVAANRLSYVFDLHGPCMVIDTACSSSLLSAHLASQSLRNGECDLALAGGVNAILAPEATLAFAQAGMMAPDGRCKTFDASADGYVRGEGCGILVLKRYSDARRDGDPILALIRGSATNQDGRSNGLTAPNGRAQETVIARALQSAGLRPDQVSYVEAHGTGTALGDAVEVHALKSVLCAGRSAEQPLILSAVKTNIGHLEAAAGVASLIKVVLALQHEAIPPVVHLRRLSPHLSIDGAPITIPTEPYPWPSGAEPRRAGISGFSFGGSNVHVILEEAPPTAAVKSDLERPRQLLTLSAKSDGALRASARRYGAYLARAGDDDLANICHTAGTGRTHFAHRLAISGDNSADLSRRLAAFADAGEAEGLRRATARSDPPPRIAFLFTGQGAQYVGMGRRLFETQPTFRAAIERCSDLARPHLGRALEEVLYPAAGQPIIRIDDTAVAQPALFAIEYALAQLWHSWGLIPDAVMGHSVGEYVAACVAGVFGLEEGLSLVAQRGQLMQNLPNSGAMAMVTASCDQVAEVIAESNARVAVAAINGPTNTVISGERDDVEAVMQRLENDFVLSQPLQVSHAFHSPLIEPALAEFEAIARHVEYRQPRIPLISNLTGRPFGLGEVPDSVYWRRHGREPVQFSAGLEHLIDSGCQMFLEIGPHDVLSQLGRRCPGAENATWLPSLKRGADDWQIALDSLAALYVSGINVDWHGFDRDYSRSKVRVPSYAFERQRCYLEPHERRSLRRQAEV